jgi:two-component system chemotaxis sensor kinase CheA
LDLAKYRALFLEEAGEHLGEMSGGLLALEKEPSCADSLALVFRMAHSIKGMASSVGYDSIAEVAHRLEDVIGGYRARGGLDGPDGSALLFRGLEALETMVAQVRETGEPPARDPALVEALTPPPGPAAASAKKALP